MLLPWYGHDYELIYTIWGGDLNEDLKPHTDINILYYLSNI